MAEHRALTHAADDAGGADALDQRFEEGVGGGLGCALGASNRVLHAPDVTAIDQTPEGLNRQVVLAAQVDRQRQARGVADATQAVLDPVDAGHPLHRQHHRGAVAALPQHRGLVDHLAVVRADGGDDPGVGPRGVGQQVEHRAELRHRLVVEVGVAPVQQHAHAAGFDVADQRAVGRPVQAQVGAPCQRRHREHGVGQGGGRKLGEVHAGLEVGCRFASPRWAIGGRRSQTARPIADGRQPTPG